MGFFLPCEIEIIIYFIEKDFRFDFNVRIYRNIELRNTVTDTVSDKR